MSCIFCQIVAGEIPATRVLETASAIVFRDLHPQAPTHLLVIPKIHYDSLGDIPADQVEAVTGALYAAVRQTVESLGIAESGYRTVINSGKWGGQSVSHLHVHILGGRQLGGSMVG